MTRTITIDPVTRIEGHAKISLNLDAAGQVTSAHLQVFEIRGFEKLLQRMELFKMPLITARICGICPAAHHLAAVTAIENGLGVEVPKDARLLRELLYMGHILHSHALSAFVLAGPDLMAGPGAKAADRNVFALLRVEPELAKKVLRLRSAGQRAVEIVGARGVHPVTAVPGGMAARPSADELRGLATAAAQSIEIIEELAAVLHEKVQAFAALHEPLLLPFPALGLSKGGELSFLEGDLVVADEEGAALRTFSPAAYAENFIEHVMPDSFMKCVRLRGTIETAAFVGPPARLRVNAKVATPKATVLRDAFQAGRQSRLAALDYVGARTVEMMFAAERMAMIAGGELAGGPIHTACEPREGRFIGAVEAPRGILIHDFTADADGRITAANLIVATQANYDAIDQAIASAARRSLPQNNDELLMSNLEFAVRCFDPCLSCATHTAGRMPMEVIISRCGVVERALVRRVG